MSGHVLDAIQQFCKLYKPVLENDEKLAKNRDALKNCRAILTNYFTTTGETCIEVWNGKKNDKHPHSPQTHRKFFIQFITKPTTKNLTHKSIKLLAASSLHRHDIEKLIVNIRGRLSQRDILYMWIMATLQKINANVVTRLVVSSKPDCDDVCSSIPRDVYDAAQEFKHLTEMERAANKEKRKIKKQARATYLRTIERFLSKTDCASQKVTMKVNNKTKLYKLVYKKVPSKKSVTFQRAPEFIQTAMSELTNDERLDESYDYKSLKSMFGHFIRRYAHVLDKLLTNYEIHTQKMRTDVCIIPIKRRVDNKE